MDTTLPFVGLVAALSALALALRIGIHFGTTPGGVDTWYYLACVQALRRTRRFPISLPQYLLHDPTESYPPGFIVLLALIPSRFLNAFYWLIAPLADALSVVLLCYMTFRLTGTLVVPAIAGLVYALAPVLISETRSLNPRLPAVLLADLAMLLVIRALLPPEAEVGLRLGDSPLIGIAAVGLVAAVFLTHTTTAIALGWGAAVLAVVYHDWRYLAFALSGPLVALLVTRGFYLRVLENHLHSARFWRRNIRLRGAHMIFDSPIYGSPDRQPTDRGEGGPARRLFRLLGENPFLVPMMLVPYPTLGLEWWGQRMYWWAIAVLALAIATTFIPPLRIFGPGRIYMKSSLFPTAFSLALAVGSAGGTLTPIVIAVLLGVAASIGGIVVFYRYIRSRTTEHTATLPPDLREITRRLASLPGDGVLCLPTMYADYVLYASGKRVLWGGHSGDLTRVEDILPVVRRPLKDLAEQYVLQFALFDTLYVTPEQLRLQEQMELIARAGSFALYGWRTG